MIASDGGVIPVLPNFQIEFKRYISEVTEKIYDFALMDSSAFAFIDLAKSFNSYLVVNDDQFMK